MSPGSTAGVRPRSSGNKWAQAGWAIATVLGLTIAASLLHLGPFATSAPAAPPTFVRQDDPSGPGGPQYNGYTVVCRDGWISHSGGRPGACSYHGGVR